MTFTHKKRKGIPNAELFEKYPHWTTHHKLIFLRMLGTETWPFDVLNRLKDPSECGANFAISFCLTAKEMGVDMVLAVENPYDFVRNCPLWKQLRPKYRKEFFTTLDIVKAKGREMAQFREAQKLDPSLTYKNGKEVLEKRKNEVGKKDKPKGIKPKKHHDEKGSPITRALAKVKDVVIVRKKVVPK